MKTRTGDVPVAGADGEVMFEQRARLGAGQTFARIAHPQRLEPPIQRGRTQGQQLCPAGDGERGQMRQPLGQRGAQSFGTHLIAGQPDPLEHRQQKFLVVARLAAGFAPGPRRIVRQSFDGIFAVVTADQTIFIKNFTLMHPPCPVIPGTDLTEIFALGLQTHNTIFLGVLDCESTNGFAHGQNSSPDVLYFESTREAKFLKKVIARERAVAIIRVRFRKDRERKFINH